MGRFYLFRHRRGLNLWEISIICQDVFDNIVKTLQDAGITVRFDKPIVKPSIMSEYSYHLLGVEWSNKHGEYEKTVKPYPVTLNWDYVDMTL